MGLRCRLLRHRLIHLKHLSCTEDLRRKLAECNTTEISTFRVRKSLESCRYTRRSGIPTSIKKVTVQEPVQIILEYTNRRRFVELWSGPRNHDKPSYYLGPLSTSSRGCRSPTALDSFFSILQYAHS